MIYVSNYRHLRMFVEAAVFALLTVAALALPSAVSAQTTARRPQPRRPRPEDPRTAFEQI